MGGFLAEVVFCKSDLVMVGDGGEAFLVVGFGGEEGDFHDGSGLREL